MNDKTNEKLTSEEIKEKINPILSKAYEVRNKNRNEVRYWLEQLPMDKNADYDEEIHNFINVLESAIKSQDEWAFEVCINELFDFYFINQEFYKF